MLKVAVNGIHIADYNTNTIEVGENETLWTKLTGFRIMNGEDMLVSINGVDHVQLDRNCNNLESYCV